MTVITVDRKVSLGLLWTMLASFACGVAYMANLNSNLLVATDTLREVKTAIEKNTAQIVKGDRTIAVLETLVTSMDRRLAQLEDATKR